MPRRRFHYDCLATTSEPRWLKVFDRESNMLSSRRLEPYTDLRAALRVTAEQFKSEGWTIEGDGPQSWTGHYFMNRNDDRWFVAIMPSAEPLKAH